MMSPFDAWALRRLVAGKPVNGELEAVSPSLQGIARHLADLRPEESPIAWNAILAARNDRNEIISTLAAIDPEGPPPEVEPAAKFATLADIARVVADQRWLWPGWINQGVLNVVAAEPGTGKTRFALDLTRRLWFSLPWPDGQPNEFPKGTRTIWIPGDQNFHELLEAARAFGLPDEAVALGSSPDDPTGSLDLDDPAILAALAERIQAASPALVIIDTVGMVTGRNLCRPEEAREFFAPIMELAARLGVAFLGQTHLSANKEALGRRIVEKARVVIKMTQPDPEGQPNRRRLWVDKTAVIKPPALGITMGEWGNDYDFNPPSDPEPHTGGRSPEKREKAERLILDGLGQAGERVGNEWVAGGGTAKTFWRAVDDLKSAGKLTVSGGPGTRKQKTLHRKPADDERETPPEPETEPFAPYL